MDDPAIASHVDTTATLIGLAIAPEHHAGVRRYFSIARGMAALVMAHPLTLQDEPAAVFVPVSAVPAPAADPP